MHRLEHAVEVGKGLARFETVAKRTKAPPYWLVAHEVICVACDGPHAHAVEIRCVECDRSLCPNCAAQHLLEHFCPECLPRRKA